MKRIILAISVMLVLGLAAAAIAYQNTSVTTANAACCCCSGDSCPMRKDGAAKDAASCCDDCCKDGKCAMKHDAKAGGEHPDNCPMMKHKDGEASHATMTGAEHQAMMAEGKSCSCSCCTDKKDA